MTGAAGKGDTAGTVRSRPKVAPAGAPGGSAPVKGRGAGADDLRRAAERLSRSRKEPRWLLDSRLAALAAYESLPLPDRVGHLWRYSEPERFLPKAVEGGAAGHGASAPGDAGAAAPEWPAELRSAISKGELAGAAWTSGGRLRRVSLDPDLARAGVAIDDLHGAAGARTDLIRRLLGDLVPAASGKFEALNAALWEGAILVHVPRGVEVAKPIHLLAATDGASLVAPRLLISIEEGASATVVDEYVSGDGAASQVYATVEDFVAPSARLHHVTIQRFGRGVTLHLSQRARLSRDAKLVYVLASLGGAVTKADLGTLLEGQGAEVELLGFLFGEGRQHFDHHTVHDHRAPHTHSDLDFKVVLKDRARSAYTGLIRIAPEAPVSEAYQENRNLLLSDGTKADSIPELEILTDEVMCTHGATVGSLDPEHLFYLESRGIPRREAVRMIVGGFIEPTLVRLPGDLRERIEAQVEAGLRTI